MCFFLFVFLLQLANNVQNAVCVGNSSSSFSVSFSQRLLFFIATTALWLPIRIAQGRSFEEVQTEVANSQWAIAMSLIKQGDFFGGF